ncbi:MAG TPA: 23S rRNA (guanosine(2251)-2'-O)-methyltransferase RlmB [Bacteroidetes bacterium]|nr:23S rRNA (guanosine(2251)-2'-O)-methyltransferase RlmB [Bacteroidota bacterium]
MSAEDLLFGRNPVEEALKNHPERVEKIYIRDSGGAGLKTIIDLASASRIPVQKVPGKKLHDMVGPVNDQGVVAQMSEIEYLEMDDWLLGVHIETNPMVMVLDELEDVANFGAILRTAAASGVDAVIVPKHRQAPVNSTVYKTSAGTAGMIPIIRVVNINQALITLKEAGFWVVGLDQNAKTTLWQQDLIMPLVVIVGSEGKGIRQHTLKQCDFTVSMPMQNNVESLNASVSAALLCYEVVRQKMK